MNVTPDAGAPPYTTPAPIAKPPGSHDYLYVVGFFCATLLLVTIIYASCSRKHSSSPPSPTYDEEHEDSLITFSRGLDDDVINVTFPTFVYSDTTMIHKFDTATDASDSGCAICLEDYEPADVVRLFPECGHLFHVMCIDTWLKAHPTCPVCRNIAGNNL